MPASHSQSPACGRVKAGHQHPCAAAHGRQQGEIKHHPPLGFAQPAQLLDVDIGHRCQHARRQPGQRRQPGLILQLRTQQQHDPDKAQQHRPDQSPPVALAQPPGGQRSQEQRGGVIQGDRGGQRQPRDGVKEQHQRDKARQSAPEVRPPMARGERRQQLAAAEGDHPPDGDQPERRAVKHQFCGREGDGRMLHQHAHQREQGRRHQHPA